MANNSYNSKVLQGLLEPLGLLLIGSLRLTTEDSVADIDDNQPALTLLLVGNGGSTFWQVFSRSAEFTDGRVDPLDRWSRRVGGQLAAQMHGRVIFPFVGPPFAPFLGWAGRTGKVVTSRLSLSIHQHFGLWHAYRFALAIPGLHDEPAAVSDFKSPCLSCADKPCLAACPVNAFAGPAFRADLCMDYLVSDSKSACRELGCAARRACPVGKVFTYLPAQAKFHMDAFVKSDY